MSEAPQNPGRAVWLRILGATICGLVGILVSGPLGISSEVGAVAGVGVFVAIRLLRAKRG